LTPPGWQLSIPAPPKAYHGLRILANTPFPFPLVQMGRTFLAFWVFTLPFALCSAQYELIGLLWCIFFVTYGFVGLEYVSTELDDPFGDDATDFDDLGMAEVSIHIYYFCLDMRALFPTSVLMSKGMHYFTKFCFSSSDMFV